MQDVIIRTTTSADLGRVAEIMHGEPGNEAIALFGNADRARRAMNGTLRLEGILNTAKPIVVAESGDSVVGMLQYSRGESGAPRVTAAQVRLVLSIVGPIGAVRLLPRLRARASVEMPIPPDSFYIAEIHVDPALRGKGIGGDLLAWAEREARSVGATRMTLTTTASNPARRLYERSGFTVIQTATNPRYRRYTGIDGRVLMEKQLS